MSNSTEDLKAQLAAGAAQVLACCTTSGGGNPIDEDYSWTGAVKVNPSGVWYEITHAEYGNFWSTGEEVEDQWGTWELVTRDNV